MRAEPGGWAELDGSPMRDRPVDLVRAAAIWAVVVGHWFVMAVTGVDGGIRGVNALARLGWAQPLTWLFQVMPLFFFVGGWANAGSLARYREAGGDALGWVVRRYRRLLLPAAVLLAVVVVAVASARLAGVDLATAATGAWVATVPLWFLAVYLAVVALAPVTDRIQRRAGLAVPVACAVVVGVVDVARLAGDEPWFASATFLVAWLGIHQLGCAWYQGRLRAGLRPGAVLAALGLAVLAALTVLGPYPVSMVRVPGMSLHNTEPPTVALLALAVAQAGVVLALHGPAARWLQRPRPWAAVARAERVVFTVFLWHMAAAVVAAVALYGTGLLSVDPIGSAGWIIGRVPWLVGCALALAVLVGLFGRVDRPDRVGTVGARLGGGLGGAVAVAGVVATLAGMVGIAVAGSGAHGPLALPTWTLAALGTGLALLARGRPVDQRISPRAR